MTGQLPRIPTLTQGRFMREFLEANQPVIVTEEATKWPAHEKWCPEFFDRNFGDMDVMVYNSLFSLLDMTTLSDYMKRHFNGPEDSSNEYVRWYSRLSSVDLPWSDAAFDRLAVDWQHPSFLPSGSYLMPLCSDGEEVSASRDLFPYRGLFLSARGARTRLHRDPLGSQAILWQVYGTKSLTFYHPQGDAFLRRDREFFDPSAPDIEKFPQHRRATPAFQDVLNPGDILFIPDGWFHEVVSLTDSISVTWNFVSTARSEPFLRCLEADGGGGELDTVRFFLSGIVDPGLSASEMASAVRRHLASRAATP